MYMYTYRYRRTKVGRLADLARTVNSSATVNVAQAVGSMDGTVHVPVYDWASYLGERLQKLPGIKSLHHLRFSKDHPGHVFVKERSDSPEIVHDLLKDVWSPAATDLPQRVTPSRLTPTRQMYLYQKIREYCPDECKDVTCPEPNITSSESASSTTRSAPSTSSSAPSTSSSAPSTSSSALTSYTSSVPTGTLPSPSLGSAPMEPPRAKRPRLCGVCRVAGHNSRSCPTKT